MSFCNHELGPVPECTAYQFKLIMRGKESRWDKLAEELHAAFESIDLKENYAKHGQWGIHPVRICIFLMLQAMEGCTDRQAAEASTLNLGWRYVLRLPMEHPGISFSTLSKNRKRFEDCEHLTMFLDRVLERAKIQQLLNLSKQRADATFIIGCVRQLNRIELVLETVRNVLEELAVVAPDWLRTIFDDGWIERYYLDRPFNYQLPKKDAARIKIAETAGADGFYILDQIRKSKSAKQLLELESVKTLETVLDQQFHPRDKHKNPPKFRDKKDLIPAGERIISPHEPEARTAVKDGRSYRGYKTHLTETCVPGFPNLITHVATTISTINDSLTLPKIVESLKARSLKPNTLVVDRGYSNVEYLLYCIEKLGIDVLTRSTGHSWQSLAGKGFDNSNFVIDWKNKTATCPNNRVSARWKKQNEDTNVYFSKLDCSACPFKTDCTKTDYRILRLKSEEVWSYMQLIKTREKEPGFKKNYSARAGAEGTVSQFIRHLGRHAKVRGEKKVGFKAILRAAALNVHRIVAFRMGAERHGTPVGKALQLVKQTA